MEFNKDLKLAVLIDADNVPYSNIKGMLEEISKYGTPTFKRIYADWTKPTVSGWKKVLLENSITPVHQFSYTSGKNATDSSMIIDAMDILYTGGVNGFCLVSSDSDFTRLASRLKEAGMFVIGMGEKKTPMAFISACDKFIYIEILNDTIESSSAENKTGKSNKDAQKVISKSSINKIDHKLKKVINDSISDLADDGGWVFLGDLGNLILKKQPDFDPRNYGYKKLLPLIKQIKGLEVDQRKVEKEGIMHVFVKQSV
ncbi:MAG: NYN domain-containing protein [Flavobacteriales bacterium]|nr:NYN domain-containing protein [Flavobacteriales bacterium]